jgi:hypothetical protein
VIEFSSACWLSDLFGVVADTNRSENNMHVDPLCPYFPKIIPQFVGILQQALAVGGFVFCELSFSGGLPPLVVALRLVVANLMGRN